jgi:hypothetical protein
MTVSMGDELRRAVAAKDGDPITVVDPTTNESYVLVPAQEYARLSSDQFVSESYLLQEEVARAAGWDDPEMDDYNHDDACLRASLQLK